MRLDFRPGVQYSAGQKANFFIRGKWNPIMQESDVGFCEFCLTRVPVSQVVRDGKVYLSKNCPKCGPTEALISSDAAVWRAKRHLYGPVGEGESPCQMHCDTCSRSHRPTVVFVDVTNRCNMKCPICIANISSMGFDFHPPMEYFDRVFRHLSQFEPKPMVELFGGEPTVRDDLIDIVNLGRSYGLRPRVVTNGLKLADEAYCEALCKAGVRLRLAIDGRSPEIYRRLRNNPGVCEKKIKALANLKKFSRRKHSLLCCAAKGVNDDAMADLIACCHEHMEVVNELALLPLAETWTPGTYEEATATTPEDAEKMIQASLPGEEVEFVPAGLMYKLRALRSFFRENSRSDRLLFSGAHPNCESIAFLASDGERYRGLNYFLRMPMKQVVEELLKITERLEGKLSRLDPRKRLQRLRGQILVAAALLPLLRRAVDLKPLFRGHPVVNPLRMGVNLFLGRKSRDIYHKYTVAPRFLGVMILPFDEPKTMNAARLHECKAAFVYEDVDTGAIKTSPACTWTLYRDTFLKRIAAKYDTQAADRQPPTRPPLPKLVVLNSPAMPRA